MVLYKIATKNTIKCERTSALVCIVEKATWTQYLLDEFLSTEIMLHANHMMSCQPLVMCFVSLCQVSPLESNVSESVCSLKFAQRVRTVEIGPSSSSRRQAENSSTSSSPTHDSVEVHTHLFLSMFFIVFFYFQTSIQAGLACNLSHYFNVSTFL